MAIAQSDQMYSKARALAYPFGNALALNAMGEVYSYTGSTPGSRCRLTKSP